MVRYWALATTITAFVILSLTVGCSDGEGEPSPTASQPTEATKPATDEQAENEQGASPIFWRTDADFDSIRADESYKVLFRITNGYDDPTLGIDAVQQDGDGDLRLTSSRADPVGDDLPGSYYPTFLNFTSPGTWQLTVHAGEEEATIAVTVVEAANDASSRY